jgi:hypothetical protein
LWKPFISWDNKSKLIEKSRNNSTFLEMEIICFKLQRFLSWAEAKKIIIVNYMLHKINELIEKSRNMFANNKLHADDAM